MTKCFKVGLLFLCSLVIAMATSSAREFNAAGKLRSSKRGVCAKHLSKEDLKALSSGVSWYYNWYYKTDHDDDAVDMEFYPMVWGASPKSLAGLKRSLEAGREPSHVLVLNEPNIKGQAFITPKRAAAVYGAVKRVTDEYGIELIGPHMAIGSAEPASITAFDPIENKDVTYTYMTPYLNAFFYFLGGDEEVSAIGVHSYGNIGELKWLVDMLEKTYPGRELWITEFAWWGAKNDKEEIQHVKQAVDFFERTPSVAKYAWFMARMDGKNKRMSLLTENSGELTELGKAYIRAVPR